MKVFEEKMIKGKVINFAVILLTAIFFIEL